MSNKYLTKGTYYSLIHDIPVFEKKPDKITHETYVFDFDRKSHDGPHSTDDIVWTYKLFHRGVIYDVEVGEYDRHGHENETNCSVEINGNTVYSQEDTCPFPITTLVGIY